MSWVSGFEHLARDTAQSFLNHVSEDTRGLADQITNTAAQGTRQVSGRIADEVTQQVRPFAEQIVSTTQDMSADRTIEEAKKIVDGVSNDIPKIATGIAALTQEQLDTILTEDLRNILKNILNQAQVTTQGMNDATAAFNDQMQTASKSFADLPDQLKKGIVEGANDAFPSFIDKAKAVSTPLADSIAERFFQRAQHFLSESEQKNRGLQWWEAFLPQVVIVSTFGGSITFSLIISDIANPARLDPDDSERDTSTSFQRETVRLFLSIAWLLFICALAVATATGLLLNFYRNSLQKESRRRPWMILELLSLLIYACLLGAFILLSLAVAAYTHTVGWVAVAITSLVSGMTLILWFLHTFGLVPQPS